MSWFKHKPRLKIPPKPQPHHYSPIADKLLKESKEQVRATDKKSKKN